ncbi:MAG: hypothetical protein JW797_16290 [Bradymonadales bacterium]|nr:hypothetical protein [Bradymonadales bacterium]
MRATPFCLVLLSTVLVSTGLLAQEDQGLQAINLEGEVVVVLPEVYNVSEDIATDLYGYLVLAVTDHPTLELVDTPPQTYDELAFAVGCMDADTVECMELIGDVLYANYIIRAELEGTGQAYVVDMAVVDCFTGDKFHRINRPIEGDEDTFSLYLPYLSEGVVWGPVGQINLTYTPRQAQVELDNQPVEGNGSAQLSNLELGPHVLRISDPNYFVYREVILVGSSPTDLEVDLVPMAERVEVRGGRLWTWIALGSGVALAGTGVAFGLLTNSTQDTFDTHASGINVDLAYLEDLQDTGEQRALLTNIFLGAGAALIATGVVLFFVEGSGDQQPPEASVSLSPSLNNNGYSLQLGIQY